MSKRKRKADPYSVLGIKKGATLAEIKAAYRKRAKETHPDKGGSDEAFRKVQEAYEALDPSANAPTNSEPESEATTEPTPTTEPEADAGKEGATPNQPAGNGPVILEPKAPMRWAEAFIAARYTVGGVPTLWFLQGNWYVWKGTHYTKATGHAIGKQLYAFFDKAFIGKATGAEPFNPNQSKVNLTLSVLQHMQLLETRLAPPFIIEPAGLSPLVGAIILRNGCLDIETKTLVPPDPRLFAVNCLPFDYNPEAPQPKRWLEFLRELWPGTTSSKSASIYTSCSVCC